MKPLKYCSLNFKASYCSKKRANAGAWITLRNFSDYKLSNCKVLWVGITVAVIIYATDIWYSTLPPPPPITLPPLLLLFFPSPPQTLPSPLPSPYPSHSPLRTLTSSSYPYSFLVPFTLPSYASLKRTCRQNQLQFVSAFFCLYKHGVGSINTTLISQFFTLCLTFQKC